MGIEGIEYLKPGDDDEETASNGGSTDDQDPVDVEGDEPEEDAGSMPPAVQ